VKAQIQIIIALVVVAAVMFSSLYFISATNARFYTRPLSFLQVEWIALDKELNTLVLLALKTASIQADQKFEELCPEDVVATNTSRGPPDNRNQPSLKDCIGNATTVFSNTASWIVGNWTQLKMKEGYFIYFNNFKAEYKADINYGYATVAFNVTIYNQLGEYRVFAKNAAANITLALNAPDADVNGNNYAQLKKAFEDLGLNDVLVTCNLNITAKITLNDVSMNYVMTPDEANFVIAKFKGWLKKKYNNINLTPTMLALYYEGNGVNYAVVGIIIDNRTASSLSPGQLKQLFRDLGEVPLSVVIDGIPVRAILKLKDLGK